MKKKPSAVRSSQFAVLIFFAMQFIGNNLFAQVSYQGLYTPATFSKPINQSLPIGFSQGVVDVSSTGAGTYTLPIQVPVGTNSIEPQLSVSYSSQSGNGIAGWGWNLSGLSTIYRSSKNKFIDGEAKAIDFSYNDVFSIDGERLFINSGTYGQNGATYDKEQIDFAQIKSLGTIGNGPQYFTVLTKDGITYEYGNSSDARVLTNDLQNVMMWRLNKVTDIHGNYMEYKYKLVDATQRELLIDEINYTGNTSMSPYNKVKFYYDKGRNDENTVYEAGATIITSSVLKSIYITGEGNAHFKTYEFSYAEDVNHQNTYLKEFVEKGTNNNTLNSTIFLYGDKGNTLTQNSVHINNISSLSADDDIKTGDINADGIADVLLYQHSQPNGIDQLDNIEIYIKGANGNYSYKGHHQPTNTLGYKNNQNELTNYDFNGDGVEDFFDIGFTNFGSANINITSLNLTSLNVTTTTITPVSKSLTLPYGNYTSTTFWKFS